ncbi:expressed unknown protein [Seminavis robusta]|uniref:Uncharacterized protein n=1 Tax=Seminavis robusta TaxID=568900 RepID=A0A9N8H2T6_9STRA|nr:expressed unknown protein [Seminavis robusta]|eukprot:Sro24_g016560.1 n/a (149) ;mRNA; r:141823-142269
MSVCSDKENVRRDTEEERGKSPHSPLTPSEKPAVDLHLPVSPTSTADVYLILNESLLRPQPLGRNMSNFSLDPTFLDTDSIFLDDECSLSLDSTDDEREEEEELLGLSFVEEDEKAPSAKKRVVGNGQTNSGGNAEAANSLGRFKYEF